MPGHARRRQVIAKVLVPRGVRAGTNAGRRRQWPSPNCLHPKSDGSHFGLREKWRRPGPPTLSLKARGRSATFQAAGVAESRIPLCPPACRYPRKLARCRHSQGAWGEGLKGRSSVSFATPSVRVCPKRCYWRYFPRAFPALLCTFSSGVYFISHQYLLVFPYQNCSHRDLARRGRLLGERQGAARPLLVTRHKI